MTDPLGGGTPHVDPDVLADLQEGLLDGPAADAATAHLADCPTCRGDLAALDEVRDLLAGAPDVGPVPADLVDRLDLALAGAAAEPALSVASTTVVPLRAPETKGPRGMRVLQMAAVLVLIFAGGALGVSALLNAGGGSSEDAGTTASDAGGDSSDSAGAATFPVTATGRDWTPEALREAAPGLASGALAPAAVGQLASPPATDDDSTSSGNAEERSRSFADAPAGRLAGGPALADCATELAGGPVAPVAVDLASYEGQPAAVLLLPTPDDPSTVDVYVVKPECPPGEFLHFVRVPLS